MTTTTDRKETEIGMIPQEWEVLKLGELVNIRRGASPRPIIDYMTISGGMPWVKIADATSSQTRYIDRTNECIKEEGIKNSVVVVPGDLILSNSATPGLPKIMRIKACIHDGWLLVSDFKGISKEYLYYFFLKFREELAGSANGSVFQNLKTDIVRDVNIPLPPLHEQEAIAITLGSIDDKIELLREQNKTLETMGQAMFKSCFVDFDGMTEFEDSEFGQIPKGWKVGKLGDVIKLLGGFPFKTESYDNNGEYKLVTIGNVNDGYFDPNCNNNIGELPEKLPDYCKLQPGDILLSLTGNVGRVCMTFGENFVLNQRVAKIMPNGGDHFAYCYFLMRQKSMQDLMISISRGTAQMNLSPIETQELNVVIPNKDSLVKMEKQLMPQFQKILENLELIESLIQTRDNLLPRLMSGKVRVI